MSKIPIRGLAFLVLVAVHLAAFVLPHTAAVTEGTDNPVKLHDRLARLEAMTEPCRQLCILDFVDDIKARDQIRHGTYDGLLDEAFERAVEAASSDSHGWPSTIHIPAGVYPISRPVVCPNVSLIGENRRATIIDGSALPADGEN